MFISNSHFCGFAFLLCLFFLNRSLRGKLRSGRINFPWQPFLEAWFPNNSFNDTTTKPAPPLPTNGYNNEASTNKNHSEGSPMFIFLCVN